MPRIIRQPLPDPPKAYDQEYMFRLVNALNLLGLQITADAEWIAARYISTTPVYVDPASVDPNVYKDTSSLPTGLLYFLRDPSHPLGSPQAYFLSIVS